MSKVSRTYRIEQETADRIADISESEGKTAPEIADDADVKQAISSAWQRCDAWRLSHAKDAPKPKPRPGGGSASQQQTQRRKEQPSHERNPNIGQDR